MGSSETVTLLFTDLVGSTAQESRLDSASADALRTTHFALLREAIEASGGTEVKNLGDGLMVAFASAGDAVSCAAAMQQTVDRHNSRAEEPLAVKIGISLGDATREDDDYFGAPVIEAARLCAACRGGQILTTQLVRMLVGERDGHRFESVGKLELKGLPEPLDSYEVAWEPLGVDETAAPLPPRLRTEHATGYIGREDEREQLSRAWNDARGGSRRVVLVSGEAGIGKTRISTQLAMDARQQGATILYGACNEDVSVPYRPFVESLSYYLEIGPEEVVGPCVERHRGELATLVPTLQGVEADAETSSAADPEAQRYLLYGAVGALLQAASQDEPVVLILDDLHWADATTLSLLKHLVLADPQMRLLVLGTYRESDISRGHPLTDLLADLRREEGVARLPLAGFDEKDVVALMEAAAGHEMDSTGLELAQELQRETAGNPFFVSELLRHLAESGAIYQAEDGRWAISGKLEELGMPQSVREVVERRVARLGDAATDVLRIAAVIGREFDFELLARVTRDDEDELLDIVDQAVEAEVLAEAPEVGRFSFAHALTAHTLYQELGATRRARVHRRIAEGLEELAGDDPGPRLPELARHWSAATAAVDSAKAIGYARQAGDRALTQLSPDEAARWFRHALELAGQVRDSEPGDRCELLLGLGEAQRQLGDAEFRTTLLDAAAIAQEIGDSERLVRAALANSRGFFSAAGIVDDQRVAVIEAALEAVEDDDLASRAILLAQLGTELTYGGDLPRRIAVSDEAVAIARRSGEPNALHRALQFRFHATGFPERLEDRLASLTEAMEIAEELGDRYLQLLTSSVLAIGSLEAADMDGFERHMSVTHDLADEVGQPTMIWVDHFSRALTAFIHGDLAEAEQLAERASEIGTEAGEPDVVPIYVGQLFLLRFEQGRLSELDELIAQTAEDNPGISAYRSFLAIAHVVAGRRDEAAEALAAAAADGFESVPADFIWGTTMAQYAEAVFRLGDREAATALYEQLAPWADQVAFNGATTWGSNSRAAGTLAMTLGRHDDAIGHLEAAERAHERMRAPILLARTRLNLAEAILARDGGDDAERAASLLAEAERASVELGATDIEQAAARLSSTQAGRVGQR